jgi:hypothetical protein
VWLYLPKTTSVSSPDAEHSTSPSDSQFEILAASATWRTKPVPLQSWRRVWKTASSIRLLSGLTSDPSRATSLLTEWMESLEDSRVRTSPLPVSAPGSPENIQDSGLSTSESFAKFGPDGSLLRTSPQLSIFQQEPPYLENLPGSGSMRSGYLYEQPMWEPRTSESGYSSSRWTTPQAHDSQGGDADRVGRHGTQHGCANLADDVALWRSPTAGHTDKGGPQDPEKRKAGGHTVDLQDQAAFWGTPTSRDHKDGACADADVETNGLLGRQVVRAWPTPNASLMNDGEDPESWKERQGRLKDKGINGNGAGMPLAIAALDCSLQAHPTPQNGSESSETTHTSRRRLNPAFTAWLMGLPWWWTRTAPISFARQEMQSYLCKVRSRLWCLIDGQEQE